MAAAFDFVIPFGPTIQVGPVTTLDATHRSQMSECFSFWPHLPWGCTVSALAGWLSNNKYALIGGLRSSAQMISYELPMSLALRRRVDFEHADLRKLVRAKRRHLQLEHSARAVPQM